MGEVQLQRTDERDQIVLILRGECFKAADHCGSFAAMLVNRSRNGFRTAVVQQAVSAGKPG